MTDLKPEDIEFAKEILDQEIERAKDMELQIGGLDAYVKRLQALRHELGQ